MRTCSSAFNLLFTSAQSLIRILLLLLLFQLMRDPQEAQMSANKQQQALQVTYIKKHGFV